MINNFISVVTQDFTTLKDYLVNVRITPLDNKVKLAALRIIAALGMVFAISMGLNAMVGFKSLMHRLLKLICAAGLFTLCYDLFVIFLNIQKPVHNKLMAIGAIIFNDIKDHLSGKKQITKGTYLRHPHANGTLLQSILWDKILWKIYLDPSLQQSSVPHQLNIKTLSDII